MYGLYYCTEKHKSDILIMNEYEKHQQHKIDML